MSGVYIKGMQKPDHCLHCPMRNSDDDCVLQRPEDYGECDDWSEQMARCPLIPVPDHGRLIDADEIEGDMQQLWLENEISNSDWIGFREVLNSVSALIPADKEEEHDGTD